MQFSRETTAQTIVALFHVIMVTQRSTEYDAVQVKALLQGYLSADVWNTVNQTRSQRSGLTNTVGDNILLLSDCLRIIEIEMLVETKIHLYVLLC